jgi:hypothetical protein
VVAMLDPAAPEIRQMGAGYEAPNDEVCVHQPFFASAEVAELRRLRGTGDLELGAPPR